MTITERLFTLMDNKNITQKQLADLLGTKQSTVSNWKTRGTTPPSEYIKLIADILNVSSDYLLTGIEKDSTNDTFYDFAKDLREMGATDEDLKKLIKFFSVIKNDSN